MNGYIIQFKLDDGALPLRYWSGSNETDSINDSQFFRDLTEARIAVGRLQGIYTDREVKVVSATSGIQLATSSGF